MMEIYVTKEQNIYSPTDVEIVYCLHLDNVDLSATLCDLKSLRDYLGAIIPEIEKRAKQNPSDYEQGQKK